MVEGLFYLLKGARILTGLLIVLLNFDTMKKRVLVLFLCFLSFKAFLQPNMLRDSSIVVNISGNPIKFAWAGGLNFTNWGMMDLDFDGFKDLVVFDKSGGIIRTFMNDKISNQVSFTHNPTYQNLNIWPVLSSWFAMFDYNCDGKEDIFTYANGFGGIRVYRNSSSAGNLQFTQVVNYLESDYTPIGTPFITNIPTNQVALPGISDVDGDGDLDIIVFDAAGYNIEYHQNQSKELGYNCDSLIFKAIDNCWGDINEGSCTVQTLVCPYPRILAHLSNQLTKNQKHAGSCIMCFDADGNSLTDVLLGDVVCDSVIYLHNGGVAGNAHIDTFTAKYPPLKPIGMSIFPCTYYIDLNNDTKRDLIASPSLQGSENVNNTWLYTNSNTDNSPVLNYVKNNFLQESMIDLGEGAYPTMFDYEGDGDLDLLVGNWGYYGSPYITKIAFYKNTGTATIPKYDLITDDYSNLSSSLGLLNNMAPTMGDLDGDGDSDLLIGDNSGRFSYFTNTAPLGPGNPAVFSTTATANFGNGFLTGMDIGNKAYPQIIDLNKDGLLDIISGSQNGKIAYYQNTGTVTVPTFSLITSFLGGINVTQSACSNGQSMPFIFSDAGVYKLLIGSECGNLFLYDNIDGNLGGTFSLISANAFGISDGEHTAPVLYDLNNDARLDLMIGNYSGGLTFYKGLSTQYINIAETILYKSLTVFPNPASENINIVFSSFNVSPKKLQVLDLSGRCVKEIRFRDNQIQLNVSEFASGIYFLNIQLFDLGNSLQNTFTQKISISHE